MQCGYAAGGLRAWAAKRISATLSTVRPPQLALERMVIRNGDLWATLTGEAIPRHIQNVNLQLKLGRDYRTLTLDITGVLDLQLYLIKETAGFSSDVIMIGVYLGACAVVCQGRACPWLLSGLIASVSCAKTRLWAESCVWCAGLAHERDAASDKCTMINSMAQRHLRDAPSAPIVNSFSEVPKVATPERSPSAQPDSALTVQIGDCNCHLEISRWMRTCGLVTCTFCSNCRNYRSPCAVHIL